VTNLASLTVLAICEGPSTSGRITGVAVSLGGAIAYFVLLYLLIRRSRPRLRWPLIGVYVVNVVSGTLIATVPNGFDDPRANYGARFVLGLGVALATALVVAARTHEGLVRLVVVAMLGAAAFIAGLIALLVFALSATGGCLD
jgi:hypothetical protein